MSVNPADSYIAQLLKAKPVDSFSLAINCDSDQLCAGVPLPAIRTRYDRNLFAMYRFLDTADSSTPVDAYLSMFEGRILLRNSNDCCVPDVSLVVGGPGDRPVVGVWDKKEPAPDQAQVTIGFFQSGLWRLPPSIAGGPGGVEFEFGKAGDTPLAGDWDGDGVDSVGVFRNGQWLLRNSNSPGTADIEFSFGEEADLPVVGDWNGDGVDTIGVFRDGRWMLSNKNAAGPADHTIEHGSVGDQPLAGDWDGDGVDTVGVFIDGFFSFRSTNTGPALLREFDYGWFGDIPIIGDWDGDGVDTIAVAR